MNVSEKAKSVVVHRQQAYQQALNPESQFVKVVMEDLERFCRGNASCFHPDPRAHALLEGRREVLLRIKDYLELSAEELITSLTKQGKLHD